MPRFVPKFELRSMTVMLSFLSALFVIPMSARTVTVSCAENTISNALKSLDPQASNTIRVSGTCHDSIGIYDFAQLTITGVTAGGKKAAIKGGSNAPVFWIVGSRVHLANLTIDGGQFGVMCREFSVCVFSGNTIQNTNGNGVALDSADATFNGDTIQNNANFGLTSTASRFRMTQVIVKGTTAGSWGPGTGVEVDSGSTLTVEGLTVDGNQGAGVSVVGDSNVTNRSWAGAFTVSNNGAGGIWIVEQSSGDISGATVTGNGPGNGGAGVVIDGNSEASFWGGGTITGNDPMDVYCGALNGIAAAPQLATIGVTNCPSTY
jgi:hypothetical protein